AAPGDLHGPRQDDHDPALRPRGSRAEVHRHQGPHEAAGARSQAVNFDLDDEQLVLQKSVRELAERLIVPNARRWDQEEIFPHEIIPAMGEMGLFGMQIPEEYGGAGMKFHDYVVALEEIARADASVGLTMASHNSLATGHLYLAG